MSTKNTQNATAVRIPPELMKRLKRVANAEGRSVTKQTARILEAALNGK